MSMYDLLKKCMINNKGNSNPIQVVKAIKEWIESIDTVNNFIE